MSDFETFLAFFPLIEMPMTLGESDHHAFSTENDPLPEPLIRKFIGEADEADDLTEHVPCFSIETGEDFHAVVWWRAGLLRYDYFLATFSKKGEPISRKRIAFTQIEGENTTTAVASIDQELVVFVAEGMSIGGDFDPTASKTYNFEMLPSGEIIQYNAALN